MTGVLIKRENLDADTNRHTGRRLIEDGVRDRGKDCINKPRSPKTASSHQKLEKASSRLSLTALRRSQPSHGHFDFELLLLCCSATQAVVFC